MKDFYFTNSAIGAGLPILTKNGAIAKQRLMDYIGRLLLERNYTPLATPHIAHLSLFSKSGHYPYYKDSMFPEICDYRTEKSGNIVAESFVLKPMNCPFHIMAYENYGAVSYRDLPIKFYEFGQVYRYEDSGALNGLYRLRSFTQDDGHLFCHMGQIRDIMSECISLVQLICAKFGLKVSVKYSRRDLENNEATKYVGDIASWASAQDVLKSVCYEHFKEDYVVDTGGAAFYGPKIDFVAKDKLNREWQLGTIQLDFNLPERFELSYIDNDGSKQVPVLIHRALLGSLERFLGILVENDLMIPYLQPFNMGVIWIGEDKDYLDECINRLKMNGIYPTVIDHPAHLNEGMVKLYAKDIKNIAIIGKREEAKNMINFNKKNLSVFDFAEDMKNMFSI
jgi:threonyl-tRNA synthetase